MYWAGRWFQFFVLKPTVLTDVVGGFLSPFKDILGYQTKICPGHCLAYSYVACTINLIYFDIVYFVQLVMHKGKRDRLSS